MSLISNIEYINYLKNQSFQNFQNLQNQSLQNVAFGVNQQLGPDVSKRAFLNAQAFNDQYRDDSYQYTDNTYTKKVFRLNNKEVLTHGAYDFDPPVSDNAYKKKVLSQEKRFRQWYNWYEEEGFGVYDANYDVVRLTTGEVLTHRAWEDGLRPPVSNENWLDDQIYFVTQKAYSRINLILNKR